MERFEHKYGLNGRQLAEALSKMGNSEVANFCDELNNHYPTSQKTLLSFIPVKDLIRRVINIYPKRTARNLISDDDNIPYILSEIGRQRIAQHLMGNENV